MTAPTASQLIHAAIGAPAVVGCHPCSGLCWLCGGAAVSGQRVEDWSGASFTGQNRVRSPAATHVCAPCVYIASRIAPVPGRPPGPCARCSGWRLDPEKEAPSKVKEPPPEWLACVELFAVVLDLKRCTKCEGSGLNPYGGNWRNYSHLYDAGNYVNASKGEKPRVLDFLRAEKRGPWFCAIADSGQKHTLPWVPVNPRGGISGRVLFEEREVQLPVREHTRWSLISDATALLTAGATKEEIVRGDYGPGAWQRCAEAVRAFEQRWANERGGVWLDLCVWLAQRDEAVVQERMGREADERTAKKKRAKEAEHEAGRGVKGRVAGADDRRGARGKARVPRHERGQHPPALGPTAGPDARGGADVREPGGVVHGAPAQPPGRRPEQEQLGLFGGAGLDGASPRRRARVARSG